MRHHVGMTAAVLAGAALMAGSALAGGDEALRDSFWSHQSVAQPGGTSKGRYMTVDPKDMQADSNAPSSVSAADASNPYFNHAMGTMTGPKEVAQSNAAGGAQNGRYTATYGQQYLQEDPADAKVAAPKNVDGDDPYFYHSMGTMGRP
jgi:hypothetical protein